MASRTLYITRAMQKGMAIMATGLPIKMSLSEMIETALHYAATRLVDGDARMDKFGAEPDAFFEIKDKAGTPVMVATAEIHETFLGDVDAAFDNPNSYEFVITTNARHSLDALKEGSGRTEEHLINQAIEFARSEGSTFSRFMALED